jgi:tetratricopeptide (TPR) repeat protein
VLPALLALALVADAPVARGPVSVCLSPGVEGDPVAACQAALRTNPPPARAAQLRLALARALSAAARYPDAVEAYRAAALAQPDDAGARLRLAEALLRLQGDAEAAVDAAREALHGAPDDARAYGVLAEALHRLGSYPEAAAAFAEAARLDPAFFENRPAARAMDAASQRGAAWPSP